MLIAEEAWQGEAGGIWEFSIHSTQLSHETKTAFKNKVHSNKVCSHKCGEFVLSKGIHI